MITAFLVLLAVAAVFYGIYQDTKPPNKY